MDTVEAKRNLKTLEENRSNLLSYNHLFSRHEFKEACNAELRKINGQIRNLEESLSLFGSTKKR